MAAPFTLFLPVVLGQLSFVEGTVGPCPRPEAVEARVRTILGMPGGATLDERATLSREGEVLKIVVTRRDGSVLGERALSATASCEDLETLASVVLASWISDVHPEFVAALPPAPSSGDMPGDESDEVSPANVVAPPTSPAAEPATAPTRAVVPTPAPAPREARRWEWGLAGGVALSDGPVGALGSLGVRWVPQRVGFGAALAGHVLSPRTLDLSSGSVRYFRWPLVVGPLFRFPIGGARLDLHGGPAIGWLHVEGRGFTPSETANEARAGGLLSLRGQYGSGRWLGFAEVSGVGWGKTTAFVDREDGGQPAVELPTIELYAALGVAWVQ